MTMRHTCYERVCYTAHRCDNHKSLRFFFPLCMRTQERMQCCYCRNESLTLGDTGFFKSHISIEMRLTAGAECRKLPRRNASIVSATARHLQSMVLEMFFSSMVNCLCEVWKVFQNDFVKPDELDKVTTSHVVCCRGLEQPIFLGQTFGQGFLRGSGCSRYIGLSPSWLAWKCRPRRAILLLTGVLSRSRTGMSIQRSEESLLSRVSGLPEQSHCGMDGCQAGDSRLKSLVRAI